VLQAKGDLDGAVAEYRKAIQLRNNNPVFYSCLGRALLFKGDVDGAITEYRKALDLIKDDASMHLSLGNALWRRGQFVEALKHHRRGLDLTPKNSSSHGYAAHLVAESERLVKLDGKLPAILSGQQKPATELERLQYAEVCSLKQLFVAAARLFQEAITAQAGLAADPRSEVHLAAASAAAQAGCGVGEDTAKLGESERARLRRQAFVWLRANLEGWYLLREKEPEKTREVMRRQLQLWLRVPEFNGVRGPDALSKLPDAERKEWQQLWEEVGALAERAAKPK
jgi:Flp pilus assembly protein TadD